MSEAAFLKLLDLGLTALQVGVEREAVLAKVTELQAKGARPEEIALALITLRDEAIAAAEKKIG